jgi:hypothetical protein
MTRGTIQDESLKEDKYGREREREKNPCHNNSVAPHLTRINRNIKL